MKVTYELLEHGWVKVGDRVKIDASEGVIIEVEDSNLHIRLRDYLYTEHFEQDSPSSKTIEILNPELIQARIAEFAAAKLEEASKAFQSLKEQLKDLKDLVS